MLPSKVLDTYALIAFFENERGADQVHDLLVKAFRREVNLAVSVINLGELFYIIARKKSPELAEEVVGELLELPISMVPADWELTRGAAQLKASNPLSYADCFAAALAAQLDCPVVTGDHEFERVANRIAIEWL